MRAIFWNRLARIALALLILTFIPVAHAHAQGLPEGSVTVAQTDPDEAFDPFSDYSEFDEDSDEEADLNFFKNGRFFTVGVMMGIRGFTGNFGKEYGQGANYGLSLSYFFDLRSAFSLNYSTGDHSVNFTTNDGTKPYSGNISISSFNFDYKHYLSTQNVTRGLADLNPYLLLGFGQFYRTYSLDNYSSSPQDATMGIDLGAGLEIPMMRRKSFFGIEAQYHVVNFGDSNSQYIGTDHLDKSLSGNMYEIRAILGMNF